MNLLKVVLSLSITIIVLSFFIPITSCKTQTEVEETILSKPVTAESLFQNGRQLEDLGEYLKAIQLYERVIIEFPSSSYAIQVNEAIPRLHYYWGLQLEEMGLYDGEESEGATKHYDIILNNYPSSQYALKLIRLTAENPQIDSIADADFDINSHFRGTVMNESSYYIVEVVVYIQLYQDINQVYYKDIVINGLKPGEEKSFEEYPWVPLHGWDNLIWSFKEILLREI
ncbi:MAG: hypothetical protein JSV74_03340 [Dehalococcoidia bacterium]|nr:MAG: hypothetical protein JSV74_03340 [Dehalococcoidia bacterium]